METIEWNDRYLTGVRAIDNDHRMLFLIVNTLIREVETAANSSVIASTISMLVDYTEVHFTREENYMAQYGYPELEEHRIEHHDLESKAKKFSQQFKVDPNNLDLVNFCAFLSDWLIHHILEEDMKYVPYLKSQGVGDSVESEEVIVTVPVGAGYLVREFAAAIRRETDIERSVYGFFEDFFGAGNDGA